MNAVRPCRFPGVLPRLSAVLISWAAAAAGIPAGETPAAEPAPPAEGTEPAEVEPVAMPWGPYLQNLTPRSVTILWTANTPNKGYVEYGESPKLFESDPKKAASGGNRSATGGRASETAQAEIKRLPAQLYDPQRGHQQEVTITGLEPDHVYYYRVSSVPRDGREPIASEPGAFRTPVAGATCFSFAVIADTHQSQYAPQVAACLWNERPDLILLAGDYNKISGGLLRPYAQVLRNTPIYFARGNHDNKQPQFVAMPGPGNELYYSFRWGNALFLSVDTNDYKGLTPGGRQYEWLENELNSSRDTWKFVFQHFPVYSAYRGKLDERLDEERRLLEKYNVDVVFQGHMHNYDRSFPLRDQKAVAPGEGVVYITASGACGGQEEFPQPHRPWFVARQWRGRPFVGLCAVNGRQASIQFVTTDGLLFDSLELKAE